VVVGDFVAFYFMTLVLQYIPVGIGFAVWAGVEIVRVVIVGAIKMFLVKDKKFEIRISNLEINPNP
jgi:multidrug transporter EmrE-like cation transporter